MRYADIIGYPWSWNRRIYPIVAHIEIATKDFGKFERLAEDQTEIRILGHDPVDDDQIVVHVGCTSEAVQRKLESAWA